MRILHLSNHCIFGNGNVHAAVDLACEQARIGHTVYFASAGGDFEELLEANGVQHLRVVHPSRAHPLLAFGAVKQLIGLCHHHKIELIHAHMMTGAVLGWTATRLLRLPLVTTLHNAFDNHAVLMGLGDRVIAVSKAVSKTMAARGIGTNKIRTVLNGTLGSARTNADVPTIAPLSRPSITTVCGLHDRKGLRDLLAAFKIVNAAAPASHLYIVGEGPQQDEYKAIVTKEGITNVHFVGQVRDPRPYLNQTDVFVLASLQDPCPLVIPEAREMGCAIVATNVDGIPEMLAVGGAGILVEPEDQTGLANALLKLINNPDLRTEEKTRSLQDVDYFSIARVCRDTMTIYSEFQIESRRIAK